MHHTRDAAPTAYPLSWPVGWKRTSFRKPAKFGQGSRGQQPLSLGRAISDLCDEFDRLRARSVVLSTNLELRADGQPRANGQRPADPGVACYFTLNGAKRVLACDCWQRIEENMRAITLHVAALRGMDRWGVGTIEQAFTGYAALPGRGETANNWRSVLGDCRDLAQARAVFAAKVKEVHPDQGGTSEQTERVVRAWRECQEEFASAASGMAR